MPVGREVRTLITPRRAGREGDRGKRSCGGGWWGQQSLRGSGGVGRPLSESQPPQGKALRKGIEGGRQLTHALSPWERGGQLTSPHL